MAEIIRVTSEALQATVRRLLPSQNGFGDDLLASSVITPIIDLTPTAEGTVLNPELNNALAFGSQTSFSVNLGTTTIANTSGFWRVYGVSSGFSGNNDKNDISISDGLATKKLFDYTITASGLNLAYSGVNFDFIAYLRAGDSLTASSTSSNSPINVTVRQVADVNGNSTVPSGFTFE